MSAVRHMRSTRVVIAVATLATAVSLAICATALALPRAIITSHYGAKVDATTGENFCQAFSGDVCQAGEVSALPGGFGEFSPRSVGAAPDGNIYVADKANNRVQELTPSGEFVLMFGKEVNETKTEAIKSNGTTPTRAEIEEENVCTQAEVEAGAKCKAGESGREAGAFSSVDAVAVDPVSGNVYVAEGLFGNDRVDEFTPEGRFVLMIGKEVNPSGGNLCTEVEVETETECRGAEGPSAIGVNEHGVLALLGGGNEIAAGGPSDLLYVGSEHRVQEFKADGTWVGEIQLETVSNEEFAAVEALTVDRANGDVYLTYPSTASGINTIYEFTPGVEQPQSFTLNPREVGAAKFVVEAMALDPSGHLAVVEEETEASSPFFEKWFGSILDAASGRRLSEFPIPNGGPLGSSVPGLAFNAAGDELYGVSTKRQEALGYSVREGAELITTPATGCAQDATQQGSLATVHCTFNGEVNPESVSETEAWFQWAPSQAIGGPETGETTPQPIATSNNLESVNATVEGLRPNSTYYYRVAAYDHNFAPPVEALRSEEIAAPTPPVPPEIVGEPHASFVRSDSAVVEAELNPENARTEYSFEYVTQEQFEASGWANASKTPSLVSARYANVEASQELPGLQPSTTYRVRSVARDEQFGFHVEGPQYTLTTLPAPQPSAETNLIPSAVTATSAIISGTIDPDGKPATYVFELGVYNPAGTQFGTVFTGAAGERSTPTPEALQLSGLQPATRYAYRIALSSGYVENDAHTVYGAIGTFETSGLPSLLAPPASLDQLSIPLAHFPRQSCKSGFVRDKHGLCVKRHTKAKHHGKRKKKGRRVRHKHRH